MNKKTAFGQHPKAGWNTQHHRRFHFLTFFYRLDTGRSGIWMVALSQKKFSTFMKSCFNSCRDVKSVSVAGKSLSNDLLGLSVSGNVALNTKSQPPAISAAPQIAKSNYSSDLLGLGVGPASHSTDFDFLGMGNTCSGPNNNNNNATCTAAHTRYDIKTGHTKVLNV